MMSKQLALSAALSILAMVGVAVFGTPGARDGGTSAPSLFNASAPTSVAPALGTLLPGLR
jgi:hypothetical protein